MSLGHHFAILKSRMRDPLQRLYETKLILLATMFTLLGFIFLLLVHLAPAVDGLHWLTKLPVGELGGTLFTTGLVVVVFEYLDGRDSETRATRRLRRILREQAPAMRDAVIEGFAFKAEDLKRVSSPEVLDRITRNSLAIQLGDQEFAEELYEDLRAQAIGVGERREDLQVTVTLSPAEPAGRSDEAPLFVVTSRCEYTMVPTSNVRRFTCVSDAAEYRELVQEPGNGSVWHFVPVAGISGGSAEAFELVEFSVDGQPRPIRRTAQANRQTYTTTIGRKAVEAGQPVKVAYTYRTLVRQHGHLLHLRIGQPTKGLSIELRYGGCGIAQVSVLDFLASSKPTTVWHSAASLSEQTVRLSFDGWALPASGVAFVWATEREG